MGNVAERGPMTTIGGPSPAFRKKFGNETVSGCGFLYTKTEITGKQQSKNFRKTQKTTSYGKPKKY